MVQLGIRFFVALRSRGLLLVVCFEFTVELLLKRWLLFEVILWSLGEFWVDNRYHMWVWGYGLVGLAALYHWWARVACETLQEFVLVEFYLAHWTIVVRWFCVLVAGLCHHLLLCWQSWGLCHEALAAFEVHRLVRWRLIWAHWMAIISASLVVVSRVVGNGIEFYCAPLVIRSFIAHAILAFQLLLHNSCDGLFIFV